MKKLFKFATAALAVVAMASCSNDDFSLNQVESQDLASGDLLVTMDELQDEGSLMTRSYLSNDSKTRYYTQVDELKVYDNDLHKYDIYRYNFYNSEKKGGTFKLVNSPSNVNEAKWALYPKEDVQWGNWTFDEANNNSQTEVAMTIHGAFGDEMEYDACYDAGNDLTQTTPLYKDVLPRWGAVEAIDGGDKLQTNLKYLTGVLRLRVAGITEYADHIMVKMFEGGVETNPIEMSGLFTTILGINNVPQVNAAFKGTLAAMPSSAPELYDGVNDHIIVDLTTGSSLKASDAKKAVIYVPLVTTDKEVDIVVYTSTDGGTTYKECKRFENKKIVAGKIYGNSKTQNLAVDGDDPDAISDALELDESGEETVVLTAENPITVCADGAWMPGNTILIPNISGAKEIIIDVTKGLDGCPGPQKTLYIKYKDNADKFKGQVFLVTNAAGGNPVLLDVDLDESGFGYVGSAIDHANDALDIDAKAFVLGFNDEYFTKAKIASPINTQYGISRIKLSNNVKAFGVAPYGQTDMIDAAKYSGLEWAVVEGYVNSGGIQASGKEVLVDLQGEGVVDDAILTAGNINISDKAIANDDITSEAGDITIYNELDAAHTGYTYLGSISAYTGNVSLNAKNDQFGADRVTFSQAISAGKDVTLDGIVDVDYDVVAGQDFTITGTAKTASGRAVNVGRKATVNVEAQNGACIAVRGTINYQSGADYALDLLQGYVYGVDATAGSVALTFADVPAYAAIGSTTSAWNIQPQNASIWNGDAEIAAYPYFSTYYEVDGASSDADGRPYVWTATSFGNQLINPTAQVSLASDIDLNNEKWQGIDGGAFDINGNYKTISNINLCGIKAQKNAGLYARATGDFSAQKLTLDKVSTNIAAISGGKYSYGTGALAGRVEGNATLSRVTATLTGDAFGSNGSNNLQSGNIGGLIGAVLGDASLEGTQVDASAAALTGYYAMGGFIGKAGGKISAKMAEEDGSDPEMNLTVTGLKFNVTYLDTENSSNVNDMEQGKTGLYVGTANLAKDIKLVDVPASDINTSLSISGKADESKAFYIESTTKRFFFNREEQTLIGQSGFNRNTGNITVNGKKYDVYKEGEPYTAGAPKFYSLTLEAHND